MYYTPEELLEISYKLGPVGKSKKSKKDLSSLFEIAKSKINYSGNNNYKDICSYIYKELYDKNLDIGDEDDALYGKFALWAIDNYCNKGFRKIAYIYKEVIVEKKIIKYTDYKKNEYSEKKYQMLNIPINFGSLTYSCETNLKIENEEKNIHFSITTPVDQDNLELIFDNIKNYCNSNLKSEFCLLKSNKNVKIDTDLINLDKVNFFYREEDVIPITFGTLYRVYLTEEQFYEFGINLKLFSDGANYKEVSNFIRTWIREKTEKIKLELLEKNKTK